MSAICPLSVSRKDSLNVLPEVVYTAADAPYQVDFVSRSEQLDEDASGTIRGDVN